MQAGAVHVVIEDSHTAQVCIYLGMRSMQELHHFKITIQNTTYEKVTHRLESKSSDHSLRQNEIAIIPHAVQKYAKVLIMRLK